MHKKSPIVIGGQTYERLLIRTELVKSGDDIVKLAASYVEEIVGDGDIIAISERIVAISQGRSFPIKDIKPGWWAKHLWKFVHNHPGGIGLRDPHTMQLAIQEAGVPRILLAAGIAAITKPFGLKGMFYRVAGHNINAIDGPCDYSLPPSNTSAKLGPKDPQKVAQNISDALSRGNKHIKVAIIDANDYGINVLGTSRGVDTRLIEKLFKDNPMGQSDEQTPITIVTKLSDSGQS
ncbi:coenzyme F420-0:L-glutamate ligase [Candidatus Woesebacteria bacterium]|nr:coenzyme F420-0:L-glutamate ligase [Candidatus Woesebacteria bacterium]